MGSIGESLFGGGGTDIEQVATLTPSQRDVLDAISQQILSQFGGGPGLTSFQGGGGGFGGVIGSAFEAAGVGGGAGQLRGITPFQGIRPGEVPFGPLQQQAFGLAGGLGQGIGGGIDIFGQALGGFDPSQGQGLLGQGVQALQGATQPFDPQSIISALEPGRQLALRTFERDIVPNLLERFGATSGASGALNQALSEAGAGLSLGLGAQAAGPLIQGQQAQLNRQLAGAGQFGQFAGIPGQLAGQGLGIGGGATDLLSQLFGFGGLQQGLGQSIAGAEQARFQEAQPFANPFLNLLGPALGTQAFQNVGVQQPPGVLSGALGGFGSLLTQPGGISALGGNLGNIFGGVQNLFGGGFGF